MKLIMQMPDDFQEPKHEPLGLMGCLVDIALVLAPWVVLYLIIVYA